MPGQTSITPTWLCQPGATATCPITQVATCPTTALQTSLECPAAGCNAKDVSALCSSSCLFNWECTTPWQWVVCFLYQLPAETGTHEACLDTQCRYGASGREVSHFVYVVQQGVGISTLPVVPA